MSISSNFPILAPTLTHDFVKTKRMDPRITFTRASSATYFSSNGTLTIAANNEPRFDHDPTTLSSRGFLPEYQRTNSIRNNTMVGAVAGAPGTPPTNWGIGTNNAELGVNVAAVGVESGINYIDVTISGNVTSSRDMDIRFEEINIIAAANAQSWSQSVYLRQVGGTQGNISGIYIQSNLYTSGSAYITTPWFAAKTVTTAALATQRFSESGTLSGATIAFIAPFIKVSTAASGAVNLTLRIGLPQLEQGKFVTSVIPTTNAAVTRSQDVANMTGTDFSSWFNSNEFTIVLQARRNYSGNFLTYPNLYRMTDGTVNNQVTMYGVENTTQITNFSVTSANTGQTDYASRTISDTSTFKAIQGLRANSSTFGINGVLTTTDTSVAMPIGLNRLFIGYDGGGNPWNGYIERISYYPVLVTNAQLQALTL